jgi:hypothetical protein
MLQMPGKMALNMRVAVAVETLSRFLVQDGATAAQDIVAKTHIVANFTVNSKLCAILDVGCLAHSGERQAGEFVEKLLEFGGLTKHRGLVMVDMSQLILFNLPIWGILASASSSRGFVALSSGSSLLWW